MASWNPQVFEASLRGKKALNSFLHTIKISWIKKSSAEVKIFKIQLIIQQFVAESDHSLQYECKPKVRAFNIMDKWVTLDFTWVSTQLLKCKLGAM
jgi:hypothetical protein